ncbi:MAG TPA: AarF/ABC1/UbiB kinase family protein, partial [Acidimicrobiales bacterium]|nr:AarF/ABC1/UbiB kinase family protein [Acidimicrobiales bacterium]
MPVAAGPPPDVAWAAFNSDDPPWVLNRDDIQWLPEVGALRAAAAREVPVLTAPSTLPPGARVGRVSARLVVALVPWLVRKRRRRYDTLEASRTDLSRRLRLAA